MAKPGLHKVIDAVALVRCVSGVGVIREEVWKNSRNEVVRYNLAFINLFLTSKDNGRVLGYDNAHGQHHRHFRGVTTPFDYEEYDLTEAQFLKEVDVLKREMP
jgi:hypothetical protein